MTAMPRPEPAPADPIHPLTIAEYAALGETESGYTELIEGNLLMSPSPVPDHNFAIQELAGLLRPQLPDHLETVPDMDVDLELAAADQPGFSRRPDLIVVDRAARRRVRDEGGMIRASEVMVVVEAVSPSSRRIDHVDKRRDYADAGIPYYWIIDIDDPLSLVACHLTEEFGYQDHQTATEVYRTEVPFPVEVSLGLLR